MRSELTPGSFIGEGYLLDDIGEIAYYTSVLTNKLLTEKGFPNSLIHLTEKYVLLGTEMSELADAVKKGLGDSSEGDELADIIIRACNFLCAQEVRDYYLENFKPSDFSSQIIQVVIDCNADSSDVDKKYEIIGQMMSVNERIKIASKPLIKKKWWDGNSSLYILDIIDAVNELIALCQFYCDLFLPKNLQDYVESKMTYNFKRPFQYNTCKEFNK